MGRENKGNVNPNVSIKFFEGEKWLVLTGLLGLLLAGICGVWVLLFGGPVGLNGDVLKAFSFDAALGMFVLTSAAIMPFAAIGVKSKNFYRRTQIILALFSYFAETVQNFRGINPRFVENGSPFDHIVSALFSLTALLLALNYFILAIHFFRKRAYVQNAVFILGIRYAMIAVMIAFAAGIWISINQGRFTGLAGNLIWLHGLGFHALQAVPFVAWLTVRKSVNSLTSRRYVHITGITFILGLVSIGWQTYLGHSIFTLSAPSALILCCYLISLVPVVLMLRRSEGAYRSSRFDDHHVATAWTSNEDN